MSLSRSHCACKECYSVQISDLVRITSCVCLILTRLIHFWLQKSCQGTTKAAKVRHGQHDQPARWSSQYEQYLWDDKSTKAGPKDKGAGYFSCS